MRFYRIYELDRADKIRDIRLLEAADDSDALQQARRMSPNIAALEVWDQKRLVGQVIAAPAEIAPLPIVAAAMATRDAGAMGAVSAARPSEV